LASQTAPRLADTEFANRLHHELWPFHGHPNGPRMAQMGNIMQDLSNLAQEGVYVEPSSVREYVSLNHPELSTGKDVEEYAKLVMKAHVFYHREMRDVGETLARSSKQEAVNDNVATTRPKLPVKSIVLHTTWIVVFVVCIAVIVLYMLQS